jgi:Plavaka transposase
MANPNDFVHFHFEPYELPWKKKDMLECESTRVYGELYTSPAFLTAYEELQNLKEPGCMLLHVLVGLMLGSDSTHLTSFGSSSLWPCYLYFGNESKHRRSKPSCKLCNHIAYFQKVSPWSVNSLLFHQILS